MFETGVPSGGLDMFFNFLLIRFNLCKYLDTDYSGLEIPSPSQTLE
jgi:hypothetical protein